MKIKGDFDGVRWIGFSRQRPGRREELILKYRLSSGIWKSRTAPSGITNRSKFLAWARVAVQDRAFVCDVENGSSFSSGGAVLRASLSEAERGRLLISWAHWCAQFSLQCAKGAAALASNSSRYGTDRWVYFIQQGETGPIKIGITDNIGKRMRALQIGSAHPLHCAVAIRGDAELEAALHKALSPVRLRGEWFKPCAAIFKLIELALATASHAGPREDLP